MQRLNYKEKLQPEVLCAVLVREPLWLEARMDDQALLEGIVVFSDEDGPGKRQKFCQNVLNLSPFSCFSNIFTFKNCKMKKSNLN